MQRVDHLAAPCAQAEHREQDGPQRGRRRLVLRGIEQRAQPLIEHGRRDAVRCDEVAGQPDTLVGTNTGGCQAIGIPSTRSLPVMSCCATWYR